MTRLRGWGLTTAALLLVMAPAARAQYGYGGWGGWGGAPATVAGSNMMGAGMMAAGAGQFNVDTAQARSVNAQTNMMYNQYLYEAQQERNQRYYVNSVNQRNQTNKAYDEIQKKLSEDPDERDIMMGDALNVAYDEITKPNAFATSVSQGQAKIPAKMIRTIPFSKASAGVTLSMSELTNEANWPATIRNPKLKVAVDGVKTAGRAARAEEEANALKPETIKALQAAIENLRKTVLTVYPENTFEWRELRPYLRGLAGLARMLETPDLDVLLKNVDEVPDRSVADLIQFMSVFQLRFGKAETPEQRMAYMRIYPLLDSIRRSVRGQAVASAPMPPPSASRTEVMKEVFGNIPEEHMAAGAPLPPVPSVKVPQ